MELREIDLKIQSYIDGELSPREMLELEKTLETSSEGRETLEWLTQVKRLVRENEPIALLETPRELYWEAIEREIQGSVITRGESSSSRSETSFVSLALRWLAPVSVACLVAAILISVSKSPDSLNESSAGAALNSAIGSDNDASLDISKTYLSKIDEAPETSVPSSSISTFEFTSNDMTVVWIEENE